MQLMEQTYSCIKIRTQKGVLYLQMYRPLANNSLNALLMQEMMEVLQLVETDEEVKVVVLEGLPDHFCTGMDFNAASEGSAEAIVGNDPNGYYNLLKHFSGCSKVIIAKVEGKVNAGGIGLVAASDIVIADPGVTFGLSEALFGLLPACVLPFLIRRIGYQKAMWLTLTTQGVTAERAWQIGLADELTTNISDSVRKNLLRLTRLDTATILSLKQYMSALWIISEETQQLAVDKITSLVSSEKVQLNIQNFIKNEKFPWEKS